MLHEDVDGKGDSNLEFLECFKFNHYRCSTFWRLYGSKHNDHRLIQNHIREKHPKTNSKEAFNHATEPEEIKEIKTNTPVTGWNLKMIQAIMKR